MHRPRPALVRTHSISRMVSEIEIKHVDAILKLMSSLTGDSRFEDIINETGKSKKEMITVCEALDRIEKRGNFMSIIEIVNNYKNKKKLSQKAACEDLSIDYKEYLAAKRFMKKVNAGIN